MSDADSSSDDDSLLRAEMIKNSKGATPEEGLRLVRAFMKIHDPSVRAKVLKFAEDASACRD